MIAAAGDLERNLTCCAEAPTFRLLYTGLTHETTGPIDPAALRGYGVSRRCRTETRRCFAALTGVGSMRA